MQEVVQGVQTFRRCIYNCIKTAFHDTDTDILARIVARMSACREKVAFKSWFNEKISSF